MKMIGYSVKDVLRCFAIDEREGHNAMEEPYDVFGFESNDADTGSEPADIARQELHLLEALDGFESPSTPNHGDDALDDGHDNLMFEFGWNTGALTDGRLLDGGERGMRGNETHLDRPSAGGQSSSANSA